MTLTLPDLSLVVLVGVSGSGKSTFARKHFRPTEILSSDACRAMVSDDENNQAATKEAFDLLHFIARQRLAAGRLTVVDATNVQPEARQPLVEIAREYHCLPVAIVLDVPERVAPCTLTRHLRQRTPLVRRKHLWPSTPPGHRTRPDRNQASRTPRVRCSKPLPHQNAGEIGKLPINPYPTVVADGSGQLKKPESATDNGLPDPHRNP